MTMGTGWQPAASGEWYGLHRFVKAQHFRFSSPLMRNQHAAHFKIRYIAIQHAGIQSASSILVQVTRVILPAQSL